MGILLERPGSATWLIVLCFASVGVAAEEPDETAPVALYTPPLRTPAEAAGTGLAPEVTVRVTVNAKGRVSAVEVEAIQPSSDHDDVFERLTREVLERWRFAPALRDGQPVETTLSWMVQFPEIEAEGDAVSSDRGWRLMASERQSGDLRQRILSLPLEQRVQYLEEKATLARDCLEAGKIEQINSPRFMVFTDAPNPEVAQVLTSNLESTFNILNAILGGLDAQPEPYRIVVFMYATEAEFSQLRRRVQGLEWSAGFYNPIGMLAFHMQMQSNEALLSIMLHEATHAYLDRYLARPGVVFPRWLDEGFADYVGNSRIRKGQLIPGKKRATELYRAPWGAVRGRSQSRFTVDEVRKAMQGDKALTIEELISTDVVEFYGERRPLFYAMSWLLVHFLRHGGEDWAEERFPELMLYVAEGYSAPNAFRTVYGDPAEFDQEFRSYVKRF